MQLCVTTSVHMSGEDYFVVDAQAPDVGNVVLNSVSKLQSYFRRSGAAATRDAQLSNAYSAGALPRLPPLEVAQALATSPAHDCAAATLTTLHLQRPLKGMLKIMTSSKVQRRLRRAVACRTEQQGCCRRQRHSLP